MSQLDQVLLEASELVTPTPEEESKLAKVAVRVTSLLEQTFSECEQGSRPELSLGGSYAKGTWLKGAADIDYFLLYPVSYPREKIETEAIEFAKKAVKDYRINMRYAEHPYVEVFVDSVRVNLVPCYKVARGDWQSAADRSPYHTEYIKSKYDEKLRLETRLLKKFVKSAKVYGAEVKVQGFSGYVCEVLTLKYGNFENVVRSLAKATQGQVISVEEYDEDFVKSFRSPLVILDPVDTARNLGSAISIENVAKLVMNCRRFIEGPELKYFLLPKKPRRPKISAKLEKELLSRTVVITFPTGKRSVDILWGQLRKSVGSLSQKLVQLGFDVIRSEAASNEIDESAFMFLLLERKISRLQLRQGPEFFRSSDVEKYLEKNRSKHLLTWIGPEGRIDSVIQRGEDATDALITMKMLLSDRVKVEKLGLSKRIRDEIAYGFRIHTGASVIKSKAKSRKWLSDAVSSLISGEPELDAK